MHIFEARNYFTLVYSFALKFSCLSLRFETKIALLKKRFCEQLLLLFVPAKEKKNNLLKSQNILNFVLKLFCL